MNRHITHSPEESMEIGRQLGATLQPNSVLFFEGDLGAGKTTFIKGVVEGVTGASSEEVTSPTFPLLNIYQERVFHFDLYRLKGIDDFIGMGFDEYLVAGGISCIEWSERIAGLIANPIHITITSLAENEREIIIGAHDEAHLV